jgi:hypothetical protein
MELSQWFSDQFDDRAELAEISFMDMLSVNDIVLAVHCFECEELIEMYSSCKFCNS